jgi:predicted ATPase
MKLQFASTVDRLYGRSTELAILESAYNKIQSRGRSNANEEVRSSNFQEQEGPPPLPSGPLLVLLEGVSGNGKTSLIHHFGVACGVAAATNKNRSGSSKENAGPRKRHASSCYLHGKFNEQHQKPYAAFTEAFEDLLTYIIKHPDTERERLGAIRQAVKGDNILEEVIPSLSDVTSPEEHDDDLVGKCIGYDTITTVAKKDIKFLQNVSPGRSRYFSDNYTDAPLSTDQSGKVTAPGEVSILERRHQTHFRFQAFVRALCNHQPQPLVLFLDDLQWADAASLELFKALVVDTSSDNLLVIGAFRGEEVLNDDHPLRLVLSQLEVLMLEQGRYQHVVLNDLALSDLNDFVAASLELAPQKTLTLSQVVLRKTHGNIFYSKEFLKHLEAQKLIRYDLTYFRWMWDVEEVSGSTNISDNVVDLVTARIRELPDSAIWILKVCSCLWFSFHVAVLDLIVIQTREELNNHQNLGQRLLATTLDDLNEYETTLKVDVTIQSEVMQGLLLATERGLLDRMQEMSFKFAHDRIREATYGLIEEGDERDRMHFAIGELLFRMYHSEISQQWMLFSSVEQLNKISSHVHSPKLRLRLAELNLEAAECATSVSAFLPAIAYLNAGIDLLGASRWDCNYGLCIKMFSKLADLESSVGHSDEAAQVIAETIKRSRSFEDKLSVLTTRILSLSVQGELKESLDMAFGVLEGLGEHFPLRAKGRVFNRKIREDKALTARLLQSHTEATILNLPLLTDDKKQCALRILNRKSSMPLLCCHCKHANMCYSLIYDVVLLYSYGRSFLSHRPNFEVILDCQQNGPNIYSIRLGQIFWSGIRSIWIQFELR